MYYTIIKTEKQFDEYCNKVFLLSDGGNRETNKDEIEILEQLIKKWEDKYTRHYKGINLDPIQLLKALMENHGISEMELANLLNKDKSIVIQILSYKQRFSQEDISRLCDRFNMMRHAFTRHYRLL